MHLLTEGPWFN